MWENIKHQFTFSIKRIAALTILEWIVVGAWIGFWSAVIEITQ